MALQAGTTQFLDEQLQDIRKRIELRAQKIMDSDDLSEQMAVAKAAELYAPGREFMQPKEAAPTPFWSRISESFSGITLVSAALAVIFGVFGYLEHGDKDNAQRWLDVAKIFAGAVVGSAGATVVGAGRKGGSQI